jgi:hypothetical protein
MNLAKKLSRGIAGWLLFEHSCHRGPVFSEKYLSYPIAQILNTEFGTRVHSEVPHPILGPFATGPGRRPELDFAVVEENKSISVAIESKWISEDISGATVEKILWDLIRLAMLGNNMTVKCYFILAGRRGHLLKLFNYNKFNGPLDKKGRTRPILKVRKTDFMNFRIDSPTDHRAGLLKKILAYCQDVELPTRLGTGPTFSWPANPSNSEYQVFVWEIMPNPAGDKFKPRNHNYYSLPI